MSENSCIFCSECGNRLPSDAIFCNVCGTKVKAEPVEKKKAINPKSIIEQPKGYSYGSNSGNKLTDVSKNYTPNNIVPKSNSSGKTVAVIFIIVGIIMGLYSGSKDAGTVYCSYDGQYYTAGSIMEPDKYEANIYSAFMGAENSESAVTQLNKNCSEARLKYMPGYVIGWIMLVGGGIALKVGRK